MIGGCCCCCQFFQFRLFCALLLDEPVGGERDLILLIRSSDFIVC